MRAIGLLGEMLSAKDIYRMVPSLFDTIFERISQNIPVASMEEMQEEMFRGAFRAKCCGEPFNTYPVDVSDDTGECYKGFLGLCVGMGRLPDVLENMKIWADQVDSSKSLQEEKCGVLLTDKWNAAEFEPYEQQLRYLAMNRNFWFVLLLSTKHGITEIPFLPPELYSFTRHQSFGERSR